MLAATLLLTLVQTGDLGESSTHDLVARFASDDFLTQCHLSNSLEKWRIEGHVDGGALGFTVSVRKTSAARAKVLITADAQKYGYSVTVGSQKVVPAMHRKHWPVNQPVVKLVHDGRVSLVLRKVLASDTARWYTERFPILHSYSTSLRRYRDTSKTLAKALDIQLTVSTPGGDLETFRAQVDLNGRSLPK
jgi:hypothetical protein